MQVWAERHGLSTAAKGPLSDLLLTAFAVHCHASGCLVSFQTGCAFACARHHTSRFIAGLFACRCHMILSAPVLQYAACLNHATMLPIIHTRRNVSVTVRVMVITLQAPGMAPVQQLRAMLHALGAADSLAGSFMTGGSAEPSAAPSAAARAAFSAQYAAVLVDPSGQLNLAAGISPAELQQVRAAVSQLWSAVLVTHRSPMVPQSSLVLDAPLLLLDVVCRLGLQACLHHSCRQMP